MNNRTIGIIIGVAVLLACCVLTAIGIGAYTFLGARQVESEPIEAVPLVVATDEPTTTTEDVSVVESTEVDDTTNNEPEVAVEPAQEAEEIVEEAVAAPALQIFVIQQAGSLVRFELDEDLRGNRITVVGSTDQVAGQIAIDYANASATELGVITINAAALATDNDFRNRAISSEILDTGQFEFITFVPTSLNGLPDSIAVGETVTFDVVGDLTIRDLTNAVTFTVTVTAVSETEISGTASATVTQEMYGINIPSVPGVANVEEEIELYIDFIANTG